ncbi:acetyltransferase [Pseudomonadota bacterium]
MASIDIFNGDADGLCALQQLRLANPKETTLVTGVKRDISLLKRVDAAEGDDVTVLDISLDKNREPLEALLAKGVNVRYFDHHFAGDIPKHANLETHIDLSADTCTSLIVNKHLKGAFSSWAVVGAFGDNFDNSARSAAQGLGLRDSQLDELRELGICLNYNGYGATVGDLYFAPDDLAQRMRPFKTPMAFIKEGGEVFQTLSIGSKEDIAKAEGVKAESASASVAVFIFPAEAWARRVSGVYGNQLATANPERAHALLTQLPQGGYVVSVRAPMNNKEGADELCRSFPTGGGRKAAAGINNLTEDLLDEFIDAFQTMYG